MSAEATVGVTVLTRASGVLPDSDRVLTGEALAFVATLERRFRDRRTELLARRRSRQRDLDAGAVPGFLVETRGVRTSEWSVAVTPPALERRRVEITGPVDRKMMINALNSGADAFMADFEDALSPSWENVVAGQANVQDAVRGTLAFTAPDGRTYTLNDERATLLVRPRGWHLVEAHVLVDDAPMSASLFDFGLAFFHNAAEQLARGVGPYFYLPKLESHLEARLWNDVFTVAQELLGVPHGSIRVTVLIETVLAAFEMDEILYELRDHAAGLNAGRWDYIFSVIKKFSGRADMVLPDRAQITMTAPFMRAYTELLVRTCHRRGAHAMGGMAAFVPNRRDAAVTAAAVAKVREDKQREARDGFDGTWVAHPDLVPIALDAFRERLGDRPNQKDRMREDVHADAHALLRLDIEGGRVTEAGVRINVDVALRYLDAWLRGSGAVAIHDLMEDAATAEIARAQLWQWTRHRVPVAGGAPLTATRYRAVRDDALAALALERGAAATRIEEAAGLLDGLVLGDTFTEFLTIPAYDLLDAPARGAAAVSAPEKPSAADVEPIAHRSDGDVDEGARTRGSTSLPTRGELLPHRAYSASDVARLRGPVHVEHTLARRGAHRLRELIASRPFVRAIESARGGESRGAFPDPSNDVSLRVRRLSDALLWASGRRHANLVDPGTPRDGLIPIVADAGRARGPLGAFELSRALISAGAAGVRFDDRLVRADSHAAPGDAVLVPSGQVIRVLVAARLAADVLDVPTLIVARTGAALATRLMSDVDARDRPFMEGVRTSDGYRIVSPSTEHAIARALAFAPFADVVSFAASAADIDEARRFAEAVHAGFPGKLLAYDCRATVAGIETAYETASDAFRVALGALGYRLQVDSPGDGHSPRDEPADDCVLSVLSPTRERWTDGAEPNPLAEYVDLVLTMTREV